MRWLCAVVALVLAAQADARDPAQVRAFRKANPCPATGQTKGACSGFVVDHIVPLCGGGADHPANLQWQGLAESRIKDKREVRYCACLKKKQQQCELP